MLPRLTAAVFAWLAAAAASVTGLAAPDRDEPLSITLFVIAALLTAAGGLLLVRAVRHRSARRRARAAAAASALRRLEYLPPVTTRTPLLRWKGERSSLSDVWRAAEAAQEEEISLTGSAQHPFGAPLAEPARPRLASSTTRPQTDMVEAGPRVS